MLSLIRSDLFRYYGRCDLRTFVRCYLLVPGFRYTFWLRLYRKFPPAALLLILHYRVKFGIDIPPRTQIGAGLFIGHFGGIVVSEHAVIGRDCNLSHDVTIGQTNRGEHAGHPTIGDGVYIGPGAKVIGNIRVGNNVAIGANSVVTRDVPDNAVVAGVPARVLSFKGATGYVNRRTAESGIG